MGLWTVNPLQVVVSGMRRRSTAPCSPTPLRRRTPDTTLIWSDLVKLSGTRFWFFVVCTPVSHVPANPLPQYVRCAVSNDRWNGVTAQNWPPKRAIGLWTVTHSMSTMPPKWETRVTSRELVQYGKAFRLERDLRCPA